MKINYLPTFIKDLKDLKSTSPYSVIKNLVFTDILAVKQLSEINNLKKLKGEYNAYRIRIGDYRIVFLLKKIQLHLLVFFIVENSIVISRKISVDKESLKSLCRNSPQNESLRSRFQLLPTSA
ncbi:toxin RelE domain protein [Microcystis aeruginosa TAIHU98]|jgi:mRNA-degrading endonuclease RelE of RelBE toxin-antitoxin system|uniref:Toxin RelE domain protein n=4 Tax=Microcystis aeruginosa TaxID=1126 RepID=L7EBC0_MICAE|nr:toxin RelE domain protein [Microcystis aeruginosa TAIHU98]